MKLISVNVGLVRAVDWKGKTVNTGIFKEPVSKRVMVRSLNLEGDKQADLIVHGGADKAVYVQLCIITEDRFHPTISALPITLEGVIS